MALGLSQLLSCVLKGWESRHFPVTCWYSLEAASKIAIKLCVDGLADWMFVDMGTGVRGEDLNCREGPSRE